MTLLVLLVVTGLGLLSLSAISMRGARTDQWRQQARDNARLALLLAIGELQRSLGPDQRVSGSAELLAGGGVSPAQPYWTAAWPTHAADGGPVIRRDPESGSLIDVRTAGGWDRRDSARFLVSGNEGPVDSFGPERPPTGEAAVELVGAGSLGGPGGGRVVAPRVRVRADGDGHYAWWVGDLGVKANVASGRLEATGDHLLIASRAGLDLLDPPLEIDDAERGRLGTLRTLALVDGQAGSGGSFHELTVDSVGVLADARNGGLKKDLTAFLSGGGRERPLAGADGAGDPGISDDDRMVGPPNEQLASRWGEDWEASPFRDTAPRFGLLRGWARLGAQLDEPVGSVVPKPEPDPRNPQLDGYASANLSPAAIGDLDSPSLVPILVEGSMFSGPSYHQTAPGSYYAYQLRLHIYPRVALWNPYGVPIELEPTMVMVQVNGRKETKMEGPRLRRLNGQWVDSGYRVSSRGLWVFGGRSTDFYDSSNFMHTTGFNDPYMGSLYFALPATRFEPGECLVFSPAEAAEYDEENLANNQLSSREAPHPSRSFSFSEEEIGGGIRFRPELYWEMPPTDSELAWLNALGLGWDLRNQADDFRMMLKSRAGQSHVDFETFDELPQIAVVSSTLQYGAGWEPRISWADNRPMVMEETDRLAPEPTLVPDVRTRQGIRLRWFDETASNQINSGALAGSPHFESALLANWNPRAAYALRTPWENIAGPLPADGRIPDSGVSGGPWFFGAYTRDLFDPAVDWVGSRPQPGGGNWHGNPFGQPIDGLGRYVVFDAPDGPGRIASLAQFQHVKLSEFVWHPSLAIGQSLVDPRCGPERTIPDFHSRGGAGHRGWNASMIGWSNDTQRSRSADEWAAFGRAITQDYAVRDALVYDLSYEVNHSLWDRYFLSTGGAGEKARFAADPAAAPLPNGRMTIHSFRGGSADGEDLADYHRAAAHLLLDGAFNVNSTSIEAWVAMLSSTRDPDTGMTRVPRLHDPAAGEWDGRGLDREEIWAGGRQLRDREVRDLAEAIVAEVKARGPFLGLADFVNRRLADDDSGRGGALQAAIDASGINRRVVAEWPIDRSRDLRDYRHPDNIRDATLLDQRLKADSKAWGAPGYLSQGDLLQVLGPVLAARSDSFVVRAYGDAVDDHGRLRARAWCEAVVQRVPEPVAADASGLNPRPADDGRVDFGRRFVLRRFRWLQADEI